MFADHLSSSMNDPPKSSSKTPVVRGARACSVCRAAKMKCVGGEEGVRPCQRCKRSGADCIFEKHRRGRKPGSKLSEASKVLRSLEKGLGDAKLKVQVGPSQPPPLSDPFTDRFPNNELPPLNIPPDSEPSSSRLPIPGPSRPLMDERDEEMDRRDDVYPAQLIRRESERPSFFKTILNPEPSAPTFSRSLGDRSYNHQPPPQPSRPSSAVPPVQSVNLNNRTPDLQDPVSAGIIDEQQAGVLIDLLFLRLNPFVNVFDPVLHTVPYLRSRSPFLFTTLIMACCKFFKSELYAQMQKLAQDYAIRAFAENWNGVEVVQAFACLTYWKEPEDTRTWMYIGYACRLAVEIGLNRYVGRRPQDENEFQMRERRNRERTYLILFVHDRSLSTQTGRQWMLPEDDLVRHSMTWHGEGSMPARPEDVIVTAFVQLWRIASETTEAFKARKDAPSSPLNTNYESLLRTCNGRLTQWVDTWQHEMRRAGGEKFHFAFMNIFRLHVRLFLNSFGVQAAMSPMSRVAPNLQALSACFASALEILQIVVKDFAAMSMLRYSQDSLTVMTAYAAVFLLKLLRSPNTVAELHEGATDEIYGSITRVSEAYHDVANLSAVLTSAAYHSRFLRGLVENDMMRLRQLEQERRPLGSPSEMYRKPLMQSSSSDLSGYPLPPSRSATLPPIIPPPYTSNNLPDYPSSDAPSRSGTMTTYGYPSPSPSTSAPAPRALPLPTGNESDTNYWKNMFRDLGFGAEGLEPGVPPPPAGPSYGSNVGERSRSSNSGGVSSMSYHDPPSPPVGGHGYGGHAYQHQYSMGSHPPPPPSGFGP